MSAPKKSRPYADTKVALTKSRADIDKVLAKHGVRAVQWTTVDEASILRFQFEHEGNSFFVRFVVDPRRQGDKWERYDSRRTEAAHFQREARRLHRVLFYAVKSRLEVIESGLETPLTVWLPQLETGTGQTVSETLGARAQELSAPRVSVGDMLALSTGPS